MQATHTAFTTSTLPNGETSTKTEKQPWHAWLILLRPDVIASKLELVRKKGLVDEVPNVWQIELGVLSMLHRVLFRSETIGTCQADNVRASWRARLLENRALRAPFLIAEQAIYPFDFSGLLIGPDRLIRHLLAAHHDGLQFAYDLTLLSLYPGALEKALDATRQVTRRDTARSRWLRDLVVYDGYHERLEASLVKAIEEGLEMPPEQANNPDVAFGAYLRWCARQPKTPEETFAAWRAGSFQLARDTGELV